MTFRAAPMLWILAASPLVLLALVATENARRRLGRRFVSERLRGLERPARGLRPWLATVALALAVVAFAGPRVGFEMMPVSVRESGRILVIDVSNSMAATDAGTSRLSAAKAIATRLIEAHSGRVGLVAFEAAPEVMAPLTSDADAVALLIDSLDAGELAEPGSDIGAASIAALSLLDAASAQKADIVVISDGEEQGTSIRAASLQAKEKNVTISTVMIGSRRGTTIPTVNGPLRDESGRVVTTFAMPDALQELATRSGGVFLENPFGAGDLAALAFRRGAETREALARVPLERYQWPLAFAFFLALGASLLNRGAE